MICLWLTLLKLMLLIFNNNNNMTIFSDNIGNYFLGDSIYGNHNLSFPTTDYFKAFSHVGFISELTQLFIASGLKFRGMITQSDFNSIVTVDRFFLPRTWFALAPREDIIDDRWTFQVSYFLEGTFLSGQVSVPHLALFNNSGYVPTNNETLTTTSRQNLLSGLSTLVSSGGGGDSSSSFYLGANAYGTSGIGFKHWLSNPFFSPVYFSCVADDSSLSMFIYQKHFQSNLDYSYFIHLGIVKDVNTGFNYYSADIPSKTVFLICFTKPSPNSALPFSPMTNFNYSKGFNYINFQGKFLKDNGDAIYPIVCSDNQSPTPTWATDFYVFDDNSALGSPAIGKMRNLLLATGSFTIGKIVRIDGDVFPDGGSNAWIPVGVFAGKTVLMRCYSSAIV